MEKKDVKVDKKRSVRRYTINCEEESKNKVQDDNVKWDKCIMCGAFHDLDDCSVFMF